MAAGNAIDTWVPDSTLSVRFPIYTRANVGEVFPDPVTPLTFDLGLCGNPVFPAAAGPTRVPPTLSSCRRWNGARCTRPAVSTWWSELSDDELGHGSSSAVLTTPRPGSLSPTGRNRWRPR
jgi:hypothetical protein